MKHRIPSAFSTLPGEGSTLSGYLLVVRMTGAARRTLVLGALLGMLWSTASARPLRESSAPQGKASDEEPFTAEELQQIYGLYIDAYLARNARDATRELEILHQLARRRVDSGYIHTRIAEALLGEGRTEEALEEARTATRLAPDDFETHQVLGQVYFQNSDIVRAATEFERALELHPFDYASLLYLGEIYEMAGEFLEAATVNLYLAYLRPNQAWQHRYKAAVNFSRSGQLEQAIDMLERVLQANPSHYEAFLRLGALYESLERWPDAIRIYKGIIRRFRLSDAVANAHVRLGEIYYRLGQSEQAETELKWVVENRPGLLAAHRYLGILRFYSADYDAAIKLLTVWVEENPERVGDAFHLARAYEERAKEARLAGDVAGAAADASAAVGWYGQILDTAPDHMGALARLYSMFPPERIGEAMARYDAAIASVSESATEEELGVRDLLHLAILHSAKAEAAEGAEVEDVTRLAPEAREQAARLYQQVLEKEPDNAAALEALAALYRESKDWDNARKCYQRLVEGDAEDVIALYLLGYCEVQLREYESAKERFLTALEHAQEEEKLQSTLYYYLGVTEFLRRDYAAAEEALRKGMELTESDVDFVHQLSVVLLRREKYSEAEALLGEALEDKPADIELSTRLAMVYGHQKKFPEAVEVLEKSLEQHPNDRTLQMRLAGAYGEKGDTEKAEALLEAAIEANPEDENLYLQLAFVFEKQKAIDRVEEVIRRLLEVHENSAAAFNFLGYTYADHNMKLDEAFELITKALAIEPDNGMYVDSLGWVHYRQGKYRDAVRELRRAVDLMGEDPVILEHLGDALHALGHTDEALSYWRQAFEFDSTNEKLKAKIDGAKQARH